MHDTAPASEFDYVWPVCVACNRDLWTDEVGRYACRPCGDRALARIQELPALFRQLDTTAALMRGARRPGAGGGGSKTPPIPPRLEVLALVGPGGVAARLQAVEDSWRLALGWGIEARSDGDRVFGAWRSDPARDVPARCTFLANNLLWACGGYESVADDIEELRRLHGEMKALVDDERRPGRVQIGNCPGQLEAGLCWQPLTARADSHRVHCPSCNARWETIGEWRELRAAQEAVLAELATRHGAEGVAA